MKKQTTFVALLEASLYNIREYLLLLLEFFYTIDSCLEITMSKYNKELIGVKMLENGAVELLMKYKNLDEPKWVNFNEIDPKSLSLSLAFLGKFIISSFLLL